MLEKTKKGWFACMAQRMARWSGSSGVFLAACLLIILWAVTGPIFHYSDTWQLVINTGTTIITFLMVFLIQNTQNRDSKAMQLKLDELIRATEGAHTVLLDLEELSEQEIDEIRKKYHEIAQIGLKQLRSGKSDTHIPQVVLNEKIELDANQEKRDSAEKQSA